MNILGERPVSIAGDASNEPVYLRPSEKRQFDDPCYDVGARQCVIVGLCVYVCVCIHSRVWDSCKVILFKGLRIKLPYYCVICTYLPDGIFNCLRLLYEY